MEKVNKNSLIGLSLIYNYLANDETCLSKYQVDDFIENVVRNLGRNYQIATDDEEFEKKRICGFKFDEKKDKYVIESLQILCWEYGGIDSEILKASLESGSLSSIFVNKEALKIDTVYVQTSGVEDIYSLGQVDAIESAKRCLESDGCRNIRISGATPDQLHADKGYHVHYSCEKPIERIDINKVLEKVKK